MNAFANGIFTVLFGWTRDLFSSLWRNYENPTEWITKIGEHWVTYIIVIAIVGLFLEKIIYFFRWRPDYIWRSRRNRRRNARKAKKEQKYINRKKTQPNLPARENVNLGEAVSYSTQEYQCASTVIPSILEVNWDDPIEIFNSVPPINNLIYDVRKKTDETPNSFEEVQLSDEEHTRLKAVEKLDFQTENVSQTQEQAHPGLGMDTIRQSLGMIGAKVQRRRRR